MPRRADGVAAVLLSRRWLQGAVAVYGTGLVLGLLVSWGPVGRFDERATSALNGWVAGRPWLSGAATAVTMLGAPILLTAVVIAGAAWLWRRGEPAAAWALALSGALGATVETALKLTVARARPELDALVAARGNSFPSGHATNSMIVWGSAAWLCMGERVPRSAPPGALTANRGSAPGPTIGPEPGVRRINGWVGAAIAVSVVVGTSRVALGVHHPFDVLAGWLLALLWLALTLWRTPPVGPARPSAGQSGSAGG